jgi:hypothetical protein
MSQANARTAKSAKGGEVKEAIKSTATESMAQSKSYDGDGQRQQMIAERAYQKAEARGFAPGGEEQDWLEAEREVEGAIPNEAPAPMQ